MRKVKREFPAKQSMWVVTGRKEGRREGKGREGEQEGNARGSCVRDRSLCEEDRR